MTRPTAATSPEDMRKSRAWTGRCLSGPAALPISFTFDGRAISGIPEAWQPTSRWRRIDANIFETIFEATDARTGLNVRVECTEYRDFPVVEWVAWFTNSGTQATPIIRDILAIDGAFEGAAPTVYHCNGDYRSDECYEPVETALNGGETLAFAPHGGRPCDRAFPYYRVMFEGCGLSMAIGWPGQWSVGFQRLAEGVHIRAGQEKTHLRLEPGEKIRTPRITLLSWTGDRSRALNLWRRWYLTHILPKPNGQPMKPLLSSSGTDDGKEFTDATEENQLRYMEKTRRHGISFDVWWIDAGWYPCPRNARGRRSWSTNVGTWEPDPERFPHGFKAVSDCAARTGADLLLWFEPERVYLGTQIDREHPEWLLRFEDDDSRLLNLGNPECRQWLTDHLCRLIKENGIKIYRQDFNFVDDEGNQPLKFWRDNEDPDRQGMNENLHVQGYLQFWDDLLKRNPGLWIDSCAGGGRRNDLETLRRSVPLHYTDHAYGVHPIKLAYHRTLFEWIPYFKSSTHAYDLHGQSRYNHEIDSYSIHCGMAAMLSPSWDIRRDDYDYALANRMIDLWRRASDVILYGDYYPLTRFHRSAREWVAWQFDRPETGCGLVQGVRFPESPDETFTIHPKEICPEATYAFENPETGDARDITGDALNRDGFTFALPRRSAAIWFYRRKSEQKTSP